MNNTTHHLTQPDFQALIRLTETHWYRQGRRIVQRHGVTVNNRHYTSVKILDLVGEQVEVRTAIDNSDWVWIFHNNEPLTIGHDTTNLPQHVFDDIIQAMYSSRRAELAELHGASPLRLVTDLDDYVDAAADDDDAFEGYDPRSGTRRRVVRQPHRFPATGRGDGRGGNSGGEAA